MFIFHKSILFINYKHIFNNINTKKSSFGIKEIHQVMVCELDGLL